MRSRPDKRNPAGQRGFSLLEVMFASTILSIFVLGLSGFWFAAGSRVADLVLKQKAIFVLSGEMERLSTLYVFTGFATDPSNGPVSTTAYGNAILPGTRLIYPNDLSSFLGGSNNFVTTSASTFTTGSEFLVWVNTSGGGTQNRSYVWLDKSRNIVGRLSWTTTDITVSSCITGTECSCQRFDNVNVAGGRCQQLALYLEFPYRFVSATGTVTPPANRQTLSVKTIAGRG